MMKIVNNTIYNNNNNDNNNNNRLMPHLRQNMERHTRSKALVR